MLRLAETNPSIHNLIAENPQEFISMLINSDEEDESSDGEE